MKIIILFLIVTAVSCSVIKTNSKGNSLTKLTFTVESKSERIPETASQFLEYVEQTDSIEQIDSFKVKLLELMKEKAEREAKYPNEIYIESTAEAWQVQRYFGNRYTNKVRYYPENDSISVINYETNRIDSWAKLIRDSCAYHIEVDKTKTKSIHGYKCYYVKLEELSGDKNFIDLIGSTVYEMWVTSKIKIPNYLILKNNCLINEDFFPLETKKYQSKSKNEYYLYLIKEIE